MTLASFEAALERTDEIELTTTGRATGKPVSCPVWFVRRGEKLYLVPGDGTDWIAPGILQDLIPGKMQVHGGMGFAGIAASRLTGAH